MKSLSILLRTSALFAGLALASVSFAAGGALFTTNVVNNQNSNQYPSKDAVLLNGTGFDAGVYYYRVTSPGGDVLYADDFRVVTIDDSGEVRGLPLAPFGDSFNGVYVAQLSSTSDFAPGTVKSDNFKVELPLPPPTPNNTAPTISVEDIVVEAGADCTWMVDASKFKIMVADAETPADQLVVTFAVNGGSLPSEISRSQSPVAITVTVSDGQLSASATFTITIVDVTAPTAACIPTTNPSAKNIPTAGTTAGKSGMNPDGFYELVGSDNCDGTAFGIFIKDSASTAVFGPYAVGTKFKLVQAKGVTPNVKPMSGYIQVQLKGDALVYGVDSSGNTSSPQVCLVPSNPK